jgi:hypothetical protein
MDAAKEQARAHRWNAAIQERNAKVADSEIEWKNIVGGIAEQDFLDDAEKFNAFVGAANRHNGWQNTGTALDVAMESIAEQEQEISNMETTQFAEERALREQAVNFRLQGELNQIYARQAIKAGKARAFSTMVDWGFKGASLLM